MRATKTEGGKLVMSERESIAFSKLPISLRTQIAQLLGQDELIPVDRRKGEHSHWNEKRSQKIFLVRTPDGKKRATTPQEAASMVDCSEKFLVEYMNKPLTKFERVRTYVTNTSVGEISVSWAKAAR